MNINKYPEIQPGKKLFKKGYVSILLWTVGKAVQVVAKVDKKVKEELYKRGYLTASRPMPEGQPISGSPQGTRSAVE